MEQFDAQLVYAPEIGLALESEGIHELDWASDVAMDLLRSPTHSDGGADCSDGNATSTSNYSLGSLDQNDAQKSKTLKAPRRVATAGKHRDRNVAARRNRKPTYYVRKEAKQGLLIEVAELQAQLQTLQDKACRDQEIATADLRMRSAAKEQQCAIAGVQSALAGYLSNQPSLPFQKHIALGRDPIERHATLVAMKDAQIRDSLWYLTERMRFLNASTPHDETSRWMTPSGRFCMLKLDRTIFETTKSTREVFQTLVHYFFNREIIISEVTGELTLRIDDSPWDQGVFQSRTVSNMAGDVQVESNSAMCSTFYDQYDDYGGGRPFGVITHEFVDVDELYPYSPVERVRNDVTGVLTVTSETRMRTNAVGGREDELVIVLTRTCLLQLHFDDVPLSPHAVQELQNSVCKWGDVMLASVKETVARQDASFIEQVTDSTRK